MNVKVDGLTKYYGTQKAVDNISFEVHTGEILGFLGPNGAGKTTTMKILTCFAAPSEGDAMIGGYSIKNNPEAIKKLIGYLPESNPLYEDMPVIDYLQYTAAIQGVEPDNIYPRIKEMVSRCGLNAEKHKVIRELSKGYRQRVGLAQAMIHDPKVLILDEPTTGLDPNQIVEIRKLIKELGQEKTVILSTHILPEVEATCGRILIINNGKIVADGTADSLKQQSAGGEHLKIKIEDGEPEAIRDALNTMETIEQVIPANGEGYEFDIQSKGGQSSRKPIFNLCVEKGWTLTEMTPKETDLEDIFRNLTMQ